MSHPPPGDEKGAVDAATPTTPEGPSSLEPGVKKSGRSYALFRPEVNASPVDAEPRASEAGATGAHWITPAERVFLEICREKTGKELPPEAMESLNESRKLLLAQSNRIADALEAEGIKAYGKSKLSMIGICSGVVVEMPDFRNIVFIPSVAQRKRHQMLKHLEYFLQEHPFSRMWVFTSGDRVTLEGVRERIEWLHRRLSKLNAEPFMKAAGAEIVFRSTELGEVARDEFGVPTFHVHAHTIVGLQRWLKKNKWRSLLKAVRSFWTFHFDESEKIHQAREACKYVVKPGDLDQLTGKELAALHRQLFRLHLVQALGGLQKQKRVVEKERKKLVLRSEGQRSRWEMVENWNESRSRKKKDDTEKATAEFESTVDDWILCTLPPSYALSSRAEPLAVVLNYSGERISANRKIRLLRDACGSLFDPAAN